MARTPQELEDTVTERLYPSQPVSVTQFITSFNAIPLERREQLIQRIRENDPTVIREFKILIDDVARTNARITAQSLLVGTITKNDLDRLL